jgi:hypothetical protein
MSRKGHGWRKPSLAGSFLLCAMTYETIERHVREDAYFATAATILDLLQQSLRPGGAEDEGVASYFEGPSSYCSGRVTISSTCKRTIG